MSDTSTNVERYMVLIKALDPELYAIKVALLDTKVNPDFLPEVIRSISNICYGTGYGNVKISVSNRKIAQIAATESDFIDKPALILKP